MYYYYIIKSETLEKYYIGSCANIEKRLKYHNNGWSRYTKTGIPWILCYFEKFDLKKETLQRERFIKLKKSKKYIESLIENNVAG
ncbi:GIY-YIG nuclease family protein [Candidatus Parcubacteria bacterium]|nr:GIY-YIG nuclease family protein [Candidatus Parcubacteria bacterium]